MMWTRETAQQVLDLAIQREALAAEQVELERCLMDAGERELDTAIRRAVELVDRLKGTRRLTCEVCGEVTLRTRALDVTPENVPRYCSAKCRGTANMRIYRERHQ